jgi:hypothetical protein
MLWVTLRLGRQLVRPKHDVKGKDRLLIHQFVIQTAIPIYPHRRQLHGK